MQKCAYCGRENDDVATHCSECGTPVTDKSTTIPLANPHHAIGKAMNMIWDRWAIKAGRKYLAALIVGVIGTTFVTLERLPEGFHPWMIPLGAVLFPSTVALISFGEYLQNKINVAKANGEPVFERQLLFLLLMFVGLAMELGLLGIFFYLFVN